MMNMQGLQLSWRGRIMHKIITLIKAQRFAFQVFTSEDFLLIRGERNVRKGLRMVGGGATVNEAP